MATKTGLPTTREEVVQLLINRKTPQAYNTKSDSCSYLHSDNGGCAIGQCVTKHQAILMEHTGNIGITSVWRNGHLPKRLTNLGVSFLERVQSIHDDTTHWNRYSTSELGQDGLVWSNYGKIQINKIISDYNLKIEPLKL